MAEELFGKLELSDHKTLETSVTEAIKATLTSFLIAIKAAFVCGKV